VRRFYSALVRISGLAFILLIWQIVSSMGVFESTLFPSPARVFSAIINLFIRNNLIKEIINTLQRVLFSFFYASAVGIFFGLLIGITKYFYKSFEWVIDFFRSIPVATLYPIFILLFGINDEAIVAMTFWTTLWIITLNTSYGVRQESKTRVEVAKVYGASKIQRFKWITIYEALPQIFVGMRIAISYALLAEIFCEMFMGSNLGIGQKIYEFNIRLSTPELYALVLVTGMLGIIINRVFVIIEKKMIPWNVNNG